MAQTAFDIARKFKTDQKLVEESTFQYAKVSYDLGRPDQAITEFEKMLVMFPQSIHADEIRECYRRPMLMLLIITGRLNTSRLCPREVPMSIGHIKSDYAKRY